MENTWVSRDLSVLEATVALVEDPDLWSEIVDMAACSGLAVEDVAGSPQVIEGEYVDMPDRLVLARRSGGDDLWARLRLPGGCSCNTVWTAASPW